MIRFPRFACSAIALIVATAPAVAVELSGNIRSATGTLPPDMGVVAQKAGERTVIVGKIEDGRYRITVPDGGRVRLRLRAAGWEGPIRLVWNARTAGPIDLLIYPATVPEPALAAELIEMDRQDQAIRQNLTPETLRDPEFALRMQREDDAREKRLQAIVDTKGWPTNSMVGQDAARDAWVIVQHASPAFLKRCLPLMQAATDKLEMAPSELALSIDRVRMQDGQPQLYGSQLRSGEDGKFELYPIEDREHVDARRAAMELPPLADYLAGFGTRGGQ